MRAAAGDGDGAGAAGTRRGGHALGPGLGRGDDLRAGIAAPPVVAGGGLGGSIVSVPAAGRLSCSGTSRTMVCMTAFLRSPST